MMEFWKFLQAVSNHWGKLITGGLLMAAVALYEHLVAGQVHPGLYVYITIIFLFYAFFLAWRGENRKSVSLQSQLNNRDPERQAKRKRLWTLREEGVQLRNEVPTDHKEWYSRFDNWHTRLLEAAGDLDPELESWLYPLNTVQNWNLGVPVNQVHIRQLDWISELLNRLENYLNKDRPS